MGASVTRPPPLPHLPPQAVQPFGNMANPSTYRVSSNPYPAHPPNTVYQGPLTRSRTFAAECALQSTIRDQHVDVGSKRLPSNMAAPTSGSHQTTDQVYQMVPTVSGDVQSTPNNSTNEVKATIERRRSSGRKRKNCSVGTSEESSSGWSLWGSNSVTGVDLFSSAAATAKELRQNVVE